LDRNFGAHFWIRDSRPSFNFPAKRHSWCHSIARHAYPQSMDTIEYWVPFAHSHSLLLVEVRRMESYRPPAHANQLLRYCHSFSSRSVYLQIEEARAHEPQPWSACYMNYDFSRVGFISVLLNFLEVLVVIIAFLFISLIFLYALSLISTWYVKNQFQLKFSLKRASSFDHDIVFLQFLLTIELRYPTAPD